MPDEMRDEQPAPASAQDRAAGVWWEGSLPVAAGDSAIPEDPEAAPAARAGRPARPETGHRYEVAVLGAHLGGSMLAAVLAQNGVDVVLVDAPQDATTPAGETTVPYTAEVFDLLAARFEVPELSHLGHFGRLPESVRATSGIKKSIGFAYAEPGERVRPSRLLQFNVPGEHGESHLFRPGIEAWVHEVALSHGASAPEGRPALAEVHGRAGDFRIELADGSCVAAAFLVDLSGGTALLGRLGKGPVVQPMRHASRFLTAHLSVARPLERIVLQRPGGTPWSRGTSHLVFPGGWAQLVCFNNADEGNAMTTSVTISLDPKVWPQRSPNPAEEVRELTRQFPDLAAFLEHSVVIRPWTASDGAHYATRTVGDGFVLLDRSASRNDLVLSRDVTLTAELVHAAAVAVLEARRRDDWSPASFRTLESFQAALVDHGDRLLEMALTATTDFRLWNAFARVWLLHSMFAALSLKRARNEALARPETPDRWQEMERYRGCGLWFPVYPGFAVLFDDTYRLLKQVAEDRMAPGAAAERIFSQLRAAAFLPPLFDFADPQDRYYNFTPLKRVKVQLWARRSAPYLVRRALTRG